MEGILEDLERWANEREEGIRTIVGGDFNPKTGREGEGVKEGSDWDREGGEKRRSKDKKLNKEERILVKFVEEKGWEIFNENIKGNKEGECTYSGALGNTVIDYVFGDKEIKKSVRKMKIGDNVDSDHHSVEVVIKGRDKWREVRREESRVWKRVWDKEGCEEFRQRLGGVEADGDEMEE